MTQGYPAQPNHTPQQPQQYQQPGPQGQPGYFGDPNQAPQGYAPAPQYGQPQQQAAPQPTGQFFQQDPSQGQAAPQYPQAPQQPPAPPTADTSGFFGAGAAFCSWDNAKGYVNGTWYGGQVLSKSIEPQTDMDTGQVRMSKFTPGKPIEQLVITLQTSMRSDPMDDGRRRIPVKSDLVRAARVAYQAAGDTDIQVGGWFYATKIGQEQVPNSNGRGTVRRNTFQAVYAPPGSPDPAPQPAAQVLASAPPQQAPNGYAPQMPQGQPGPIANMPQQAMTNFAQAAQYDPAVQAAIGGPAPQQPQYQQVPQPGATAPGAPQQQAAPGVPQPGQSPQWNPFGPQPGQSPQ